MKKKISWGNVIAGTIAIIGCCGVAKMLLSTTTKESVDDTKKEDADKKIDTFEDILADTSSVKEYIKKKNPVNKLKRRSDKTECMINNKDEYNPFEEINTSFGAYMKKHKI